MLERAIAGRGAFRRFKDALFEFPELQEAWFRFSDVRMQRRAIDFLVDEGLVDEAERACALAEQNDPPVGEGPRVADARDVAAAVAADLHGLYGERLVDVVLYGSQARGDAHPDSDVDLAVILDEVASPWEELRRMDDVLWRHTVESGLTVWPLRSRARHGSSRGGHLCERPRPTAFASGERSDRRRRRPSRPGAGGCPAPRRQPFRRPSRVPCVLRGVLRGGRPRCFTSGRRGPSTAVSCPPLADFSCANGAWTTERAGCSGHSSSASQADYGLADVPDQEARRAVADAEAVVEIIEAWLEAEH